MLDNKTYNLLILFSLQKLVRKEDNEFIGFNELLKSYNIEENDTSKQVYNKLCGERVAVVKKSNKDNGKKNKSTRSTRK
jgi:hypothetical protein